MIDIRREAVLASGEQSVDWAIYGSNLGVDLLQRYHRCHRESDLEDVLRVQHDAVSAPATMPSLLLALADTQAADADRRVDDTSLAADRPISQRSTRRSAHR